jgi:toxin-antitoxin system PIN domain toxin
VIVDANLLLYAVDQESPFHARSARWLSDHLNGGTRVGLPWQSLAAFQRISTRFGAAAEPLSPEQAWEVIEDWLDAPAAWIPVETERHRAILGELITRYSVRGDLVTDARLAALAIAHGVRWINPMAPRT